MKSNPQVEGNCVSFFFVVVARHKVTCGSLVWIWVPVGESVVEDMYGNGTSEQVTELKQEAWSLYQNQGKSRNSCQTTVFKYMSLWEVFLIQPTTL